MIRQGRLLRYLLLLMLAAGPVHAQTVLLCDMMEVPRQETCCCGDGAEVAREAEPGADCDRPPCPMAPRAESRGCCDSAVEVSYEPEAGQPMVKPSADRSDLDPPAPLLMAYELPLLSQAGGPVSISRPLPVPDSDGSDLYLRTERLRI